MVIVRPIAQKDDAAMASIIFASLEEYDLAKPGTVYTDASTKELSVLFNNALHSGYLVADDNGTVVGGCGIYPTAGLQEGTAELVKMYVAKSQRGKGLGKLLVQKAENLARTLGYDRLYLESFPNLREAISLYTNLGFAIIQDREGDSCHFECDVFMEKSIV